ncbi:hypothetical protein [Kitasatospora sp. NPDC054795]
MVESEIAERIAARRAEADELEEQLTKQIAEVRTERDELAVAERVWQRMTEQLAAETAAAEPVTAQVAGRAVVLVPHRGPGVGKDALPPLGLEVVVRSKPEPLRGKAVQARRAELAAETARRPLRRVSVTRDATR